MLDIAHATAPGGPRSPAAERPESQLGAWVHGSHAGGGDPSQAAMSASGVRRAGLDSGVDRIE
jgi:hypothetical protein